STLQTVKSCDPTSIMLSGLIGSASLDVTEHFGTWALGQVADGSFQAKSQLDTAMDFPSLRKERAKRWTPRASDLAACLRRVSSAIGKTSPSPPTGSARSHFQCPQKVAISRRNLS